LEELDLLGKFLATKVLEQTGAGVENEVNQALGGRLGEIGDAVAIDRQV